MVEAIVGVALRAVLASIVLGAALALCVLVATRSLALTAAARHVLWTTALVAIGVMPLAGIGVSLWRGAVAPPASVVESSPTRHTTVTTTPVSAPRAPSQPDAARTSSRAEASSGSAATIGATASHDSVTNSAVVPSPVDRIAAARAVASGWTPRVSHALAVGAVAAWALGALIGFIGLVTSVVRVRGLKRRSSPLDGTLPDELPWLTEIGPGREIYLRLSYETETPVAIGFGRPVILIPTELATAAGLSAIEPLILHEHAHLRRYDDWTNLAQRSIERLFWFNPIVWFVGRRIALEREIASDDAVVEKTGEAHQYATSLWKLAREMRMPEHAVVAPGALLTRKQISVRIEQLLDANRARRHGSPLAAAGIAVAAVLAVGLVGTSAPAVELPAPPAQLAASALPAWTEGGSPPAGSASVKGAPKHATQHALRRTQYANTRTERMFLITSQHLSLAPLPQIPPVAPFPARHLPVLPVTPPIHMVPPIHVIPAVPAIPAPAERAPIGASDAVAIAGDTGRIVHDAMAAIPQQIAQEQAGVRTHQAPRDGTKITRELIASCTACNLEHADLRGLDLHGLRIAADELSHADLRNVNLAGAELVGVSLEHANLAGADLRGARLSGVALEGANFDGARLDGVKLIGVSLQHVSLRGTTIRSVLASCTGCDMQGMDLHGQDLRNIALTGADLSNANLRDANLSGVRFTAVDLSNAQLDGADLTNASFISCDFSGASLRDAKTTGMTRRGSGPDG
jgi:uncharacterized protein YjbI with pentapeptide repeats/beta-lactamase regulating signal transducer with metallopeptidase domain